MHPRRLRYYPCAVARSVRSWGIALTAGVIGSLSAPSSIRAASLSLERVLAMPVSPGSVILLTEHARERRATERIGTALANPRPEVRAAAARVVFVTRLSSLLPDAVTALAEESDPSAAAELMRVVAAHGGSAEDDVMLAAVARLDMAGEAGRVLASARGARALVYLEALRAMDEELDLPAFLSLATRGDFAVLGALLAKAFREGDAAFWSAYLETARRWHTGVQDGPLLFTLTTKQKVLRFATMLHFLEEPETLTGASPGVQEALATAIAGRDTLEDTEEAFLLELLCRREGSAPRERDAWIALLRDGPAAFDARQLTHSKPLTLLTDRERRALAERLHGDARALDDDWERAQQDEATATNPTGSPSKVRPTLRTAYGFPPGTVADLLQITGCKPRKEVKKATIADVVYAIDGVPISWTFHVQPDGQRDAEPCADMGRALVLASIQYTWPKGPSADAGRRLEPPGRVPQRVLPLLPRGAFPSTELHRAPASRWSG